MANFNDAFNTTMGHEGGYSNDPVDAGGETYRGISRKYHPDWGGWKIIDDERYDRSFPDHLSGDSRLNKLEMDFYKAKYWNSFLGDNIKDQDIANEMFDTAVNMGVSRASLFLQKTLNLLNNNQKRYTDISEDGKVGPNTIATLDTYLKLKNKTYLLKVLNLLQGNHYIDYMSEDSRQERFAFGWLDRVEIKKVY